MELSSGYRQRQRGCAAGSVSVDDDTVGGDDKCLSVDCIADDDQRPAEPSAGEAFVVCVVFRAECIELNTDIQRRPVSGSVCGISGDVFGGLWAEVVGGQLLRLTTVHHQRTVDDLPAMLRLERPHSSFAIRQC